VAPLNLPLLAGAAAAARMLLLLLLLLLLPLRYIPVLMAQAKIYWERENYPLVERLFRQSAEFCSEHDAWKLNVAHVFFMQDARFKEAIR
jgi:hypothetical protein